jgi:hypothetical protein
MNKMFHDEKGQTMILIPILLIVLMGFAGLAIDGGRLYLAKSQLQKAVDAGALAGADVLLNKLLEEPIPETEYDGVIDAVSNIPEENYQNGSYELNGYRGKIPIEGTNPVAYKDGAAYVEVTGSEDVSLMLMPVLGIKNSSKVSAVARVKIGDVIKLGVGPVIPIGIHLNQELTFGTVWNLTYGPGESPSPGWYGYLDFSDPDVETTKSNQGTNKLAEYIVDGSPSDFPVGTVIDVREGKPTEANKVQNAIKARDGQEIYVPIVSPEVDGEVTVLGFAKFKLIYVPDSNVIKAIFISQELPGEIGESVDYGNYESKLEL